MFRGSQKPARDTQADGRMTVREFLGQKSIHCFTRQFHPDLGWMIGWIDSEGWKRIEVGE